MRYAIAFYSVVTFLLTLTILMLVQSSLVPYNVRELIETQYPIVSSFLLVCFMFCSFGFPVYLAMWFQEAGRRVFLFPIVAILHGGVAWGILRFSVPLESIHDIVGAPILSWPRELEYIARFIPLYFIITVCITFGALACLAIFNGVKKISLLTYLMIGILLIAISHWVIVEKAATDNLTELMASGGTAVSSFLVAMSIIIIAFTASQLSFLTNRIERNKIIILIVSIIISFPLSFLSVYGATEKALVKYGQEFSALQFLLSPDRDNYVAFPELLICYAVAHTGAVLLIALLQVPIWRWISKEKSGETV